MPSTRTVWGIDVGQSALKALRLRYRDGRLQAVSFDVIEHPKILSQPDADEQQLIRSALSKFLSRNNISGSTIVVSVPGQASFTRFIKLPPVEQKKIPEIVRYEARQQIPFNLEDVVWDYQTISPPSAGPREVEVGIFAMKRDIVADYVSDFLAMKIEPDIVQMAPVALYNFLRYEKHEGGGATILIDVGAESTNLVIADADRVWIRPVPIGGNNFTNALCKAFKLPFAKAENLKRHAAESKHARKVFQAMRPVFGDLLTEIQRSIGYYTSLHRDARIERVVALGNAFRLAGLRKFLAQNLGVEVTKIDGFSSLDDAEALKAPLFRENVLSFGVAFGLAIQGLGVATIRTSLLPPEILSQKVLRRKRPFLVAAAACLLGSVFAFGYDAVKAHSELERSPGEVPRLQTEVGEIARKNDENRAKFEEQKEAVRQQNAKIESLKELTREQSYAYDLLRTVWEALPHDVRLDALRTASQRWNANVVELLDVALEYKDDVRRFSGTVVTTGAAPGPDVEVLEPGQEATAPPETGGLGAPVVPAEGPAAPAGRAGPVPGLLVRIVGITPKPQGPGQAFVNDTLIKALAGDARTVHLRSRLGEEVLARVLLATSYGSRPEYQELEVPRGAPVTPSVGPAVPRPPSVEAVDKRNDTWFEAQWVVYMPEEMRRARAKAAEEPAPAPAPPP